LFILSLLTSLGSQFRGLVVQLSGKGGNVVPSQDGRQWRVVDELVDVSHQPVDVFRVQLSVDVQPPGRFDPRRSLEPLFGANSKEKKDIKKKKHRDIIGILRQDLSINPSSLNNSSERVLSKARSEKILMNHDVYN
jgi:hypothetical protein